MLKSGVVLLVVAVVVGTAALVHAVPVEDPVLCPDPYILISNSSCLYVPSASGDWSLAKGICGLQEPPGDLAVINDCALLKGAWDYVHHSLGLSGNFWVGGFQPAADGNWVWEHTKEPVAHGVPFWFPGQPDGGTLETKLAIGEHGFLADGLETQQFRFICQYFL